MRSKAGEQAGAHMVHPEVLVELNAVVKGDIPHGIRGTEVGHERNR